MDSNFIGYPIVLKGMKDFASHPLGTPISAFPLWRAERDLLVWQVAMRRLLLILWLTGFAGIADAPLPPVRTEAAVTNRAQITITSQANATFAFVPYGPAIPPLVDAALRAHSAQPTAAAAWRMWLDSNDIVGFKVTSSPGPIAGTRPAVVRALIESLLTSGHPALRIVIWDRRKADLADAGFIRLAEELGVRCVGLDTAGWDPAKAYESPVPGKLLYGDLEFSQREPAIGAGKLGRKSHVSRLLTQEITRIITVVPLLNHNHLGVHGHIANLGLGTVDNTLRFEDSTDRLAEALPEICALDEIYPKLALCFTDALVCQFRGEERTQLHYAVALNELWISTDPVALDILALRELATARERSPVDGEKPFKSTLYQNCELLELGVADEKRFDVRRSPGMIPPPH